MAAARDAGVTRILTIGMDEALVPRGAARPPRPTPRSVAAIGRHPNAATGFDDADLGELGALAAHPRCARDRRDRPRLLPRPRAPRATRSAPSSRRSSSRATTGMPLVIHTRAAEDDTIATLAEHARRGLAVILHCFSMPDRLDECLEHGWWISFAGNVTYPKATELAEAAARVPLERLLVETDAPYLTPAARAQASRNQPANVVHTARFVAERRGISYEELEAAVEANAAAAVRLVSELPVQPSLRRLRAFGVRPEPRARPELPDRLEHARA